MVGHVFEVQMQETDRVVSVCLHQLRSLVLGTRMLGLSGVLGSLLLDTVLLRSPHNLRLTRAATAKNRHQKVPGGLEELVHNAKQHQDGQNHTHDHQTHDVVVPHLRDGLIVPGHDLWHKNKHNLG